MQDNVDTGATASHLDFLYWVPKEGCHHVSTKTVKSSVHCATDTQHQTRYWKFQPLCFWSHSGSECERVKYARFTSKNRDSVPRESRLPICTKLVSSPQVITFLWYLLDRKFINDDPTAPDYPPSVNLLIVVRKDHHHSLFPFDLKINSDVFVDLH